MSLIDLGRRSASVFALSDCKAIELTSTSLLELYEHHLEQFALIQMNISRELSRRLRIADEALFRELIQTKQIHPHLE
jgi:CRP-like cAMP-binding protein